MGRSGGPVRQPAVGAGVAGTADEPIAVQPHPLPTAQILKTTRYFEEQVLRKRPYIQREWCELALAQPARVEVQNDGRKRYWVYIMELGRYLSVVTLEDGETVPNAFPDRDFAA